MYSNMNAIVRIVSALYIHCLGMTEVTLSQELQVFAVTRKVTATTRPVNPRSH